MAAGDKYNQIAPNPAEYYAVQFANQVSMEIYESTKVHMGLQKIYYDKVGTSSNIAMPVFFTGQ